MTWPTTTPSRAGRPTAHDAGASSALPSTPQSQGTTSPSGASVRVPAFLDPRSSASTARSRKGASSRSRRTSTASHLETLAMWHLQAAQIPTPVREYRFHDERKWRFDFAWPDQRVALEVEGGTYTAGRHTRGSGFAADCDKHCEAQVAGWLVLRVTRAHIDDGRMLAWVKRALG